MDERVRAFLEDHHSAAVATIKPDGAPGGSESPTHVMAPKLQERRRIGDLCKECGQATFVYEEGCKKCLSCGFNEC